MEPVVIGPRGELLSVAACALICGIGLWIASNGNTQAAAVTELGKIDGRGPTTLRPVLVRSGVIVATGTDASTGLTRLSNNKPPDYVSLTPSGLQFAVGRTPLVMSSAVINSHEWLAIVTVGWNVILLDEDLKVVWETSVRQEEYESVSPSGPIEASVLISDVLGGVVLVSTLENQDKAFSYHAWNLSTGKLLWTDVGHKLHSELKSRWSQQQVDVPSANEVKWLSSDVEKEKGEVRWELYRKSMIEQLPHTWHGLWDTHLSVTHFAKERSDNSALAINGKANVIVAHSSAGIEVLHIHSGKTLTRICLEPYVAHADFTADFTVESLILDDEDRSRCAIAGVAGSTLLYMKYLCTDAVSDQSMVALLFHTHSNERKHRKPRLRAIILFDDTVYCLDAASGNTFWKTTLAGIDLPARLGSIYVEPLKDLSGQVKTIAVVGGTEVDFIEVTRGKLLRSVSLREEVRCPPLAIDTDKDGVEDGIIASSASALYIVAIGESKEHFPKPITQLSAWTVAIAAVVAAIIVAMKGPAAKER